MVLSNTRAISALFLIVALIPGFLFDWALEFALVLVLTIAGMYQYFNSPWSRSTMARLGFLLAVYLVFQALCTLFFTQIAVRFDTGGRDLVDIVKPFFLFFACLLPFTLAGTHKKTIHVCAALVLCYSIFCFLCIKLNVPVVSTLLNALYSATKLQITDYTVRLTMPFENPNFLGVFAVLSLYIGLHFGKKVTWFLAIPALMVVGLSGSRTAWILGAVTVLIFLLEGTFAIFDKKRRLSPWAIGLVIVAVVVAAQASAGFIEEYKRLADLISVLSDFDLSKDESYADRNILREGALALILERPLLGWGALKYSGYDVVDNQFFGLALRYGFVGLMVIAGYWGLAFVRHWRRMERTREKVHLALFYLIILAWLWTGSYLENVRLVVLVMMLLLSIRGETERYET